MAVAMVFLNSIPYQNFLSPLRYFLQYAPPPQALSFAMSPKQGGLGFALDGDGEHRSAATTSPQCGCGSPCEKPRHSRLSVVISPSSNPCVIRPLSNG